MTYSFHPEAEEEFNQAVEYYEKMEIGLGYDFAVEVYATIQRSIVYPKAWPILAGDIRRSLVKRFPSLWRIVFSRTGKHIHSCGYESAS